MNAFFLKEFSLFLDSFYSTFLGGGGRGDADTSNSTAPSIAPTHSDPASHLPSPRIIFKSSVFTVQFQPDERKRLRQDLDEQTRVIIHDYFLSIQDVLQFSVGDQESSISSISAATYSTVLELLYVDVSGLAETSILLHSMLMPMVINLIGVFLNRIIQDLFKKIRTDLLGLLVVRV